MTTRPTDDLDNNHHEHAHLDGGRCLDGTGRTWANVVPRDPAAEWRARYLAGDRALTVLPPSPFDVAAARLRAHLLLLTVAQIILAVAVVVHLWMTR